MTTRSTIALYAALPMAPYPRLSPDGDLLAMIAPFEDRKAWLSGLDRLLAATLR